MIHETVPMKHKTFIQCCFAVGQTSTTFAHHHISIGSTSSVCWGGVHTWTLWSWSTSERPPASVPGCTAFISRHHLDNLRRIAASWSPRIRCDAAALRHHNLVHPFLCDLYLCLSVMYILKSTLTMVIFTSIIIENARGSLLVQCSRHATILT